VLLLDLFEEHRELSSGELCLRRLCRNRAELITRERAAHWKQRGKFRALKEGDANTAYFQFHARATTRRRRNFI
jgi:hypothetical protein